MTFYVGECRESRTCLGVVWPVYEKTGQTCGCGAVHFENAVGFFIEKRDAQLFAEMKNLQRLGLGEVSPDSKFVLPGKIQ